MATSYTKNHIGKAINETITEAELISYFSNERQETLTLEFKSFHVSNNRITDGVFSTIAAFLNSEGGLLIYGAPNEVRKQDKYKVVQGPPTPIPTSVTTKDALVTAIADNISYMPLGININSVPMQNGGFVYLIEVPESPNKPHQYNGDRTYPVRLDGQSRSAPHYLVDMMFNQVRRPELKGFLRVTAYTISFNTGLPYNTVHLRFEVTIVNVSKTMSDSDVYIRLIANAGVIDAPTDPNYRLEKKGMAVTVVNVSTLITDTLSVKRTYNLRVNTDQLNALPDRIINVKLIFGGKNSLPKYSTYSIVQKEVNLSPGEIGRPFDSEKDLNNLLDVQKNENVFYKEFPNVSEDEAVLYELKGI